MPRNAEGDALKYYLNYGSPSQENLILKLYTNNITPANTDTTSTYTEMATQGYSAKILTGASWVVTEGNPSNAAYAQQTFSFDGTGGSTLVYGYYYVGASSNRIRGAEKFADGPYTIANNGDKILLTPAITQT